MALRSRTNALKIYKFQLEPEYPPDSSHPHAVIPRHRPIRGCPFYWSSQTHTITHISGNDMSVKTNAPVGMVVVGRCEAWTAEHERYMEVLERPDNKHAERAREMWVIVWPGNY